MDKYVLIFLLFQLCICSAVKRWRLNVVDEGEDSDIILTPGIFTKIFFVLSNETVLDFPFLEEDSYKLKFQDENIISLNEQIILTPKEKLVYSTYIGLNCKNSISDEQYEIKIEVTPEEGKADDGSIEYNNIIVSINSENLYIDMDIIMTSMPKNSFNMFQIRDEPYNVDEIRIKVSENEKFDFEDIVIKPFNEREKLYDENSANHGIFYNSPFGLKNPEENLDNNIFDVSIDIAEDSLKYCFSLLNENFEVNIEKQNILPYMDDSLKKIIKYSFQDITENSDTITTNFKIKTIIPLAPVMLICSLEQKLLIPQKDKQNEPSLIYKNIISKSGDFEIEVNNLEFNSEYFTNCEFSDTNYEDNKRNKINITIGNREDYDIVHQLKATRESKRTPQCIRFRFNNEKISEFKKDVSTICQYFMKKNDPFKVRDLSTIVCEIVEEHEKDAKICVSPSPKYNIEEYTKYDKNYNYSKYFNDFIAYVEEKYSANIVGEIEYDIKLNNSINIKYIDYETNEKKINLFFNITSENNQTIECFYNKYLTTNNSKFSEFDSSLVLYPKEMKEIQITYENEAFDEDTYTINSLNFKCYNFPNFTYKYESTDFITMYSYLNVKDLKKNLNYISNIINNPIKCNEKINQINPVCLKNEKIPINKIIKTDLNKFFNVIDNKLEQFSKLTDEAKFYFLKYLIENYPRTDDPTFIKKYFEKSIEILKYLSSIDCSNYFNTNKQNYTNCRNGKKEGMKIIIDAFLRVEIATNNISFIITNLGQNYEENIKNILIFLKELTNNEDSFEKGGSWPFIQFIIRLEEQFDEYWHAINKYLLTQENILAYAIEVKKEVLLSIFQILTNIPKIIHYEEIDGYLDKKNLTKTGLILNETSIQVQKSIINISKKMNTISLSSNFNGFLFFENILASSKDDRKSFIINKDINLEFNSQNLLSTLGAFSLQIFTFDSPLVTLYPGKKEKNTSDTLNNFITITLLKENGEEIPIKDILGKNRPKILYLKDKYKDLKGCYYYDEEELILKNDGMFFDDNYEYNNTKYYKCESSHLTMFTAGTAQIKDGILKDDEEEEGEDDSSGLEPYQIILILLGVVVLLTILIAIISHLRKKKVSSENIDSNFDKNEGLMKEELY